MVYLDLKLPLSIVLNCCLLTLCANTIKIVLIPVTLPLGIITATIVNELLFSNS